MIRFILLCLLLVMIAEPAAAGPAVGAAFAKLFVGIQATLAAGGVGAFLLRTAISVGLSLLSQALMKPKSPAASGVKIDGTTAGEDTPMRFVVGRRMVGGHLEYHNSHGQVGKTPNAYYTLVVSVCDVPGATLRRVRVNDEFVTLGGDAHPDYGFPMLEKRVGSDDYGWVRFYDGTQVTADPMLVSRYGADPDQPWTANHILSGVAYAIITLRFNREVWQGPPSLRFEMNGIPLYDPRLDSSVGGSGAQRWNNPATWAPTENLAVIAYNLMRGIPIPGGNIYGGEVEAEDLPLANAVAGMNVCDTTVSGRAQFRGGLEISVDEEPALYIEELLKAGLGQVSELGGVFRTRWGAPDEAVMAITDEDISVSNPQEFDPFPGIEATYNAIRITHPNVETAWEPAQTPALYNAVWEAEDGDRRLPIQMEVAACFDHAQAQQLQSAYIRDERRFRQHQIVLPPEAQILEPLDTIAWTSDRNGYSNKLFEVVASRYMPKTMMVALTLRERDPADYDWDSELELPSAPGYVPTERDPRSVDDADWSVTGTSVTDASGGARRPALLIQWDPEVIEDARQLEYQVEVNATGAPVTSGIANGNSVAVVVVEGILPATVYRARVRPVVDAPAIWSDWQTATTPDVRLSADDISAAIIQQIEGGEAAAEAAAQEAADAREVADGVRSDHDALVAGFTGNLATAFNGVASDLSELSGQLTTIEADIEDFYDSGTGQVRASALSGYYTIAGADSAISAAIDGLEAQILTPEGQVRASLLTGYYTEAETDSAISAAQTVLRSEIARRTLPSDFAEDGLFWTHAIQGNPANKANLGSPVTFATDAEMGRVAVLTAPITSNRHIAPKGYLPNVAGKRYRATITAKHTGAFAGGSQNALAYNLWKINSNFTFANSTLPTGMSGTLAFSAPDTVQTFTREWTCDGATPYFLPFAYTIGVNFGVAGPVISIQSIEVVDISAARDVSANLESNYYTAVETDSAIAAANLSLEAQIDGVVATLDNDYFTAAETSSAIAASASTLSAEIDGVASDVTTQGTALATLEGIAEASYVIRAQAGGAVSLLDLVAASDGVTPPTSIARLAADQIILDGSVSASQLAITDTSGNLVVNGDFARGDLRGWAVAPNDWSVVARAASGANAITTMPFAYALRTSDGPLSAQVLWQQEPIAIKAGDRLTVSYDFAGEGASITITGGIQIQWQTAAGAEISVSSINFTGVTTSWQSRAPQTVQAPAGAAYARFCCAVNGGGAGRVYFGNVRIERQRDASILITPNSITGAQLITTQALITASAQLADAVISNAKIGNLQVDNAKIANLTVGTGKIAGNAVSDGATGYGSTQITNNGTGWVDLLVIAFAGTAGAQVVIGAWVRSGGDGGTGSYPEFRLILNGVGLVFGRGEVDERVQTFLRTVGASAGTNTVQFQMRSNNGLGPARASEYTAYAIQLKK